MARSLTLGLILAIAPLAGAPALTIGFEDLSAPPALDGATGLQYTNDSSVYDGVTWDTRVTVAGTNYAVSPGSGPLFSGGAPGGGNYYITNSTGATSDPNTTYGNGITLTTNQVLQGAYFGDVQYYGYGAGEGASAISISAMSGSTSLDTLNFTLTPNPAVNPGPSTTSVAMTYFNTSSFSSLSGITGYVINRTPLDSAIANNSNVGWVADNFTFHPARSSSVPEPTNEYLLLVLTLAFVVRFGLKLRRRV